MGQIKNLEWCDPLENDPAVSQFSLASFLLPAGKGLSTALMGSVPYGVGVRLPYPRWKAGRYIGKTPGEGTPGRPLCSLLAARKT